MNIEFHYYITKYLALNAGFTKREAETIAYASQLVDDNFIQFSIEKPSGDIYQNYITQTRKITEPVKKLMRIYLLFHYMPGDPISAKVRRRDGKMHLLMTTPGSHYAQDIFYTTTEGENVYALGIASHMLADTYAHQNFTGSYDEINSMKGVWQKLKPNIGHSDALYKPDIPNLIWHDPRLIDENQEVDNAKRMLFAAKKLYSNYIFITSHTNNWPKVKLALEEILEEKIKETELDQYEQQKKVRINKYRELLSEFDDKNEYNPNRWLNETLEQNIDFMHNRSSKIDSKDNNFSFKKDFEKSDWYKFQEEVKNYQKEALKKIEPIISQLELRNW